MSTDAKFRGFAADCHRLARVLAIELDDRVLLLDMAEEWLRLADRRRQQPERYQRQWPRYRTNWVAGRRSPGCERLRGHAGRRQPGPSCVIPVWPVSPSIAGSAAHGIRPYRLRAGLAQDVLRPVAGRVSGRPHHERIGGLSMRLRFSVSHTLPTWRCWEASGHKSLVYRHNLYVSPDQPLLHT